MMMIDRISIEWFFSFKNSKSDQTQSDEVFDPSTNGIMGLYSNRSFSGIYETI